MDHVENSFNSNKFLKEEFVSNLRGSSMLETSMQMTLLALLLCLGRWIGFITKTNLDDMDSLKKNDDAVVYLHNLGSHIAMMLFDFICIIPSSLIFLTVFSEWTCACAILLALLLCVVSIKSFGSTACGSSRSLRAHVSLYRVSMTIFTCLCILAVDFKIFPRRYAKTETYGTSLMDLGVGSFVLANALVSRQARNVSSREWISSLKSTGPLLLLGFGRLAFTSGVGYQVHVGEYGVHWNFFFTLAAVSILTSLINFPPQYCGIFGSLILVGYQTWLLQGLNSYLITNERKTDIISQNKEGIFSIFGYWGMYLVGVQLGNYLFFKNYPMMKICRQARTRVWIFALSLWLITVLLDSCVERVSRRTCNLAYVSFVLATNLQALAILMLSDYIPGSKMSVIESAFDRNLLGSFILANVLTGAVNLSVDTMACAPTVALLILLAYAFVLCMGVGVADFYGWKLKFW